MTFSNCTVTAPNGELLFHPEWGIFDMAVGEIITSGYSGTADKVAFNVYPNKSEKVAIKPSYSQSQKRLFQLYSDLQQIDVTNSNPEALISLYNNEYSQHRNDWLIRLELLGKLSADVRFDTLREQIILDLNTMITHSTDADLINAGLSLYTRL
jgi:phenylalanine-4-hydroxylase